MAITAPAGFPLEALDEIRCNTGRVLDACSYGPRPTPSNVIDGAPRMRLHSYSGLRPPVGPC